MEYALKIIMIFLISSIVTFLILPGLCRIASRIGLQDVPNKRKVHNIPKPLVGGLAMFVGFSICSVLFLTPINMIGYYAGLLVLLIVGFLDDVVLINAKWKFLGQLLASALLVYLSSTNLVSVGNLFSFGSINLGIFAIPATIFGILGVVNATNMIDGLDGLAGGVSIIAFVAFAVLAFINNQMDLMLLSIALSGAAIGFLRYNWYPARLFMGDVGSFFLGFSLAFLAIAITQRDNSIIPPVVPLLILAVPIVDTAAIIIKRVIEGKSPFTADKNHLHHVILRLGLNEKNTVKVILALTAAFSCLGIMGTIFRIPDHYLFSIFLIYTVISVIHFGFVSHLKKSVRIFLRLLEKSERAYFELKKLVMKLMIYLDIIHLPEKHKRYDVNLPFSCFHDKYSENGTLIDIGKGGFSTILSTHFVLGEKKDFHIHLPIHGKLITTAEVIWSCKESNSAYRYGFEFIGIGKRPIDDFCDYLQHLSDLNIKYDPEQLKQIYDIMRVDTSTGYATPCISREQKRQQGFNR